METKPKTAPFQIRIDPELLGELQKHAPKVPGKTSGVGLLFRRLALLFVGRCENDNPIQEEATRLLDLVESGEEWEPWEVERLVDDMLRIADRSRDKFTKFEALALVGRLQLLLYRKNRP
mgnify:CR=1 FL=1